MKKLKTLAEYCILFCVGGTLYYVIERLFKGYWPHWSMFAAGGLCFVLIGRINWKYEYDMSLIAQTVVAGLIITAVEFVFGLILNVWLRLDVWDYSGLPGNVMGQIAVHFMYAWQWLSLVGIVLNDVTRWLLFGEEKPHYKIL